MRDQSAVSCWKAMRQRCLNPRNPSYPRYGGRGITICGEWDSFDEFSADMGPRPKGATLERIDNDGHYEPENVRWATRKEQAQNRCTTRMLEHRGRTMTLSDWAREAGLESATLHKRIERGWSLERALREAPDRRFNHAKNVEIRRQDVDKPGFMVRAVYAKAG